MSNIITYNVIGDVDGKLKRSTKIACNFWNHFIVPSYSVVITIGLFTEESLTIAQAYKPLFSNGVMYGKIEFNTKYLKQFTDYKIASTVIHEIGHTLGFGWDKWMELFDKASGKFYVGYILMLPELETMRVELHYGPGTEYAHWD
ncbi:MAG: hypothetical protein WAX77_14990, partial [Methylococcaceae bacterium]